MPGTFEGDRLKVAKVTGRGGDGLQALRPDACLTAVREEEIKILENSSKDC